MNELTSSVPPSSTARRAEEDHHSPFERKHSFTLIELVVVIAIIACLPGMLLTAQDRANKGNSLFSKEKNMKDGIILWEAHRAGAGGVELPESCLAAFEYGWSMGGRPEADVNITSDGVMVSLHDPTLDRICRNLPEHLRGRSISEITWAELQTLDIGREDFPDQHVASLETLFSILRSHPERNMVIDYKRVKISLLAEMINRYGVAGQITFASYNRAHLREFKRYAPAARTKIWLGGSAESIMKQFHTLEQERFEGITEVQLHLNDMRGKKWRYALDPEFVAEALRITKKHGVLLQVLPWKFERKDLFEILDLGVRSFAVDYPNKFKKICADYFSRKNRRQAVPD